MSEPSRPSPAFEPLAHYREYPVDDMSRRGAEFHANIRRRRTVRDFSPRPVPRAVIEQAILAAGTAPSGANLQPWHVAVVTDPALKRRIRAGAEAEERTFYHGGAPQAWLDALAPLGTDEHKPFLEVAPCLVVVFALSYGVLPDGRRPDTGKGIEGCDRRRGGRPRGGVAPLDGSLAGTVRGRHVPSPQHQQDASRAQQQGPASASPVPDRLP